MFRTYKELDHRSHVDLYRLLRRTRTLTISVFISRETASSRGTGGQLLVSPVDSMASDIKQNQFVKSQEIQTGGTRREALGILTSASSYYFNVNRTSLDHLLLGKNADVDKNVESPEYTAGSQRCQNNRPLDLWAGHPKANYRIRSTWRHTRMRFLSAVPALVIFFSTQWRQPS